MRSPEGGVILHGPKRAAEAIVAAEQAYSARFAEVGIDQGMRELLDPNDDLSFTDSGDPVHSSALGRGNLSKGTLSWSPAEVFVSRSGDMGASWGRYTRTGADPAKKPVTGRYVTVWRKNADGEWRAVMDIGQPG